MLGLDPGPRGSAYSELPARRMRAPRGTLFLRRRPCDQNETVQKTHLWGVTSQDPPSPTLDLPAPRFVRPDPAAKLVYGTHTTKAAGCVALAPPVCLSLPSHTVEQLGVTQKPCWALMGQRHGRREEAG